MWYYGVQSVYIYCTLNQWYAWIHVTPLSSCNSLQIRHSLNAKFDIWCEHKGHFHMNVKKHITLTKIIVFDVHAMFAFKWQLLIGVNTWHELPTQQKYDHFPLWHIFPHSNHLWIAQLVCLWVYIHIGLMFLIILIVDEQLSLRLMHGRNYPSTRIGLLRKLGVR